MSTIIENKSLETSFIEKYIEKQEEDQNNINNVMTLHEIQCCLSNGKQRIKSCKHKKCAAMYINNTNNINNTSIACKKYKNKEIDTKLNEMKTNKQSQEI